MRSKFLEAIAYCPIKCMREVRGRIIEIQSFDICSIDDYGDIIEIYGDNGEYIMLEGDVTYDIGEDTYIIKDLFGFTTYIQVVN